MENKSTMTAKIKLLAFGMALTAALFACSGKTEAENSPELNVPAELKDTAVLQADEAGAMEKLHNVIDTSAEKK
jgi:hypothetical protein